jgi:hypothetical protein
VAASSGSRITGSAKPSSARAVFTGIGFGSADSASNSGSSRACSDRARSRSPLRAAASSSRIAAGTTLPATEITPVPPTAIVGSSSASSPASSVLPGGSSAAMREICCRSPDDSLSATAVGSDHNRCIVAGCRFVAVRPGTL